MLIKAFPDGVYSNCISYDYIITTNVIFKVYNRIIN